MARRAPLPRLTQRQRLARWQRERRQRAVVVTAFGAVLFFVLGLSAWAAADRYYTQHLKPAVSYAGTTVPMRDFKREHRYQLVKFYIENQVPKEFENDSRVVQEAAKYEGVALDKLIEFEALDRAARESGVTITRDAVEQRFVADFSQYRARHVLIEPDKAATDDDAADKAALVKAQEVTKQLRAGPMDQELWNKVAKESSADPGSAESGGELGFVGKGQFVKEFEDAATKLAIGEVSEPVKSQFGYHVIQVLERKGPETSEVVQRYVSSGFSLDDIRQHVSYDLLRDEFAKRAEEAAQKSPTEQIHLAKITIDTPPPSGRDPASFTEGLRKISEVTSGLEKGDDFGELAKKHSSDPNAEKGGDAGWFARGMLTDVRAEDELFALAPGTNSRQFSTTRMTVFYRVIEKDPAREISEEQKTTIKGTAYTNWLEREKRTHDAKRLVPGFEFD